VTLQKSKDVTCGHYLLNRLTLTLKVDLGICRVLHVTPMVEMSSSCLRSESSYCMDVNGKFGPVYPTAKNPGVSIKWVSVWVPNSVRARTHNSRLSCRSSLPVMFRTRLLTARPFTNGSSVFIFPDTIPSLMWNLRHRPLLSAFEAL